MATFRGASAAWVGEVKRMKAEIKNTIKVVMRCDMNFSSMMVISGRTGATKNRTLVASNQCHPGGGQCPPYSMRSSVLAMALKSKSISSRVMISGGERA